MKNVSMVVGLIQGEGYGAFTADGKILLSILQKLAQSITKHFTVCGECMYPVLNE
jgi:hypothetical protein